jgi:hypothetical protein
MAKSSSKSALFLLLLVIGTGGWYARERTSSCVVGMNGVEATVTITGWGSAGACQEYVRSRPLEAYIRRSPAEGAVLCERQRGRNRYIVRDRGAFMLIGRAMCVSLEQQMATSDTQRRD